MAVYGFDPNEDKRFNISELLSIILVILVIVIGVIIYKFGYQQYIKFEPFIETRCTSLGLIGVLIIKFLFAFLLLMMGGILHITIIVKLMEFIRKVFNQ